MRRGSCKQKMLKRGVGEHNAKLGQVVRDGRCEYEGVGRIAVALADSAPAQQHNGTDTAGEKLALSVVDMAQAPGIGKTAHIVSGTNKICPDFDSALSRARNTAAVQNMRRFDGDQPCHTVGRCLDCRSKSRGCNALLVLWGQMMDMSKVEVVLIDEPLGL